jgi:hypothetical protein
MKDIKFIAEILLVAGGLVLMGSSMAERKGNILGPADKPGSFEPHEAVSGESCPLWPPNCPEPA